MFVEEHYVVSCLKAFLDEFALTLLLLVLAEPLCVFEFRDDLNGKRNIVSYALYILIYDGFEALVCGLAHHYEQAFHGCSSSSGFLTNS